MRGASNHNSAAANSEMCGPEMYGFSPNICRLCYKRYHYVDPLSQLCNVYARVLLKVAYLQRYSLYTKPELSLVKAV